MNKDEKAFQELQTAVIQEFQRRRSATLQACAGWFIVLLIFCAGIYGFGDVEQSRGWQLAVPLILYGGAGFCALRIYRITQDKLRCPNCDVVPKDEFNEGFPPNPARCSFCGLKLK